MRILITRPEIQAKTFAKQLDDNGFSDFMFEPLLDIHPIQTARLDFKGVDALIVTSQNAVPSLLGDDVPKHLPVFAVGATTAQQL
ncbi:MAG: uroporphyrinogen-III synthase, partial [Alphaproteobacteria bacterium]|nr:uroporphyrinogen-III synthase [Alphaproteobacteria bacterium]